MQLCGIAVNAGEKKEAELPVPGGGSFYVTLFRGANPGKTLVVTAGVHGCEYNGIEALRSLREELNPKLLHGQVILVPLINRNGFYLGTKQTMPEDHVNLNRAFPGDAFGTAAARMAAALEQHLYAHADLLADLHGGDVNEMAMPFVYFPAAAAPQVCERSRAAAQALSLPYRVASSSKNGLYSWAAQQGVPALLLERGGRGGWSTDEVAAYRRNIYELLDHLEILPQNPPCPAQKEIQETVYLEAEQQGFWYPFVQEGHAFPKGAVLGELRDYNGNLIRTHRAAFDGVALYYTVALGVQAGDPLIAYGKL